MTQRRNGAETQKSPLLAEGAFRCSETFDEPLRRSHRREVLRPDRVLKTGCLHQLEASGAGRTGDVDGRSDEVLSVTVDDGVGLGVDGHTPSWTIVV